MASPKITHHGALHGVTGSCHEIHLMEDCSILIDCGLFQGDEEANAPFAFDPGKVLALIVTHVHIDHVGRIPELLDAGFSGPIFCSLPSAQLLPLVLEDALSIQGTDRNRLHAFIVKLGRLIRPLKYGEVFALSRAGHDLANLVLERAGHVLGSAWVSLELGADSYGSGQRLIFSGDIGHGESQILMPPTLPGVADVLVLESTYGDRFHGGRGERRRCLQAVISRALADGGTVLIPAFSLGRVQELLFDLASLLNQKEQNDLPIPGQPFIDWPQVPVILDSPLGSRLTEAYRNLEAFWKPEARVEDALRFPQLLTIDSAEQHHKVVNYLSSTLRPAVVIAGSGMCNGGRIVNYLKNMLRHPRHNILFTGFQAPATPGAVIKAAKGAEGFIAVDLDGQMYDVRAQVHVLDGYSAHADQEGLVAFANAAIGAKGQVKLVHGSSRARSALAKVLSGVLAPDVEIFSGGEKHTRHTLV